MKNNRRRLEGVGQLGVSFLLLLIVATGCVKNSIDSSEEENDQSGEPDPEKLVPPDGVLEAVTWNLKWFGTDNQDPPDLDLQAKNAVVVMDSLKADLYALQEINSRTSLRTIVDELEGYRGFTAPHINWIMKTAFIYNTQTIDSVEAGGITENQNNDDWANGRYPLYFKFNYRFEDESIPMLAIVIHAKAEDGERTSYEARSKAAQSLYDYLREHEPEANIILLGDFNDDVDESIHDSDLPSPYEPFLEDSTEWQAITGSLSEREQSSYLSDDEEHTDLIDHILINRPLFEFYMDGSEEIYNEPLDFIKYYSFTTSDHLPVQAEFEMPNR